MTARTRIAAGALALVTVAHWHAHVGYLRRLNTIAVPEVEIPAPERADVKAARRLHVLVLDGLGFDKAMEVAEISDLAEGGVSRVLLADFPSYTHPSVTSMATGRPPRYSGVRINGPRPLLPWDSVAKRAAEEGIAVWVINDGWRNFAPLLLLGEKTSDVFSSWPEPREKTPGVFSRELAWIYYGGVDKAAHHSGTSSEEYEAARAEAGRRVAAAREALDLAEDALVVVSDHGHRPRGGHGGAEPEAERALFVAVGGPFVSGAKLPPAPMKDLAATLCAALGIGPPRHSLGRPMLDAFGLASPRDEADARAEVSAYRAEFRRKARVRIAIAGVLAAIAAVVVVRASRRAGVALEARDLVPTLVFVAAFVLVYWLWGYGVTWSVPRSQLVYQSITGAFALAAIVLAMLTARKGRAAEETLAMAIALGAAYVLSAAWVGPGTSTIAGPLASFLLLVVITVLFYPLVVFALRALWVQRIGWRMTSLVAFLGALLFVAPFVLRYTF